jgi:hypothetical protein
MSTIVLADGEPALYETRKFRSQVFNLVELINDGTALTVPNSSVFVGAVLSHEQPRPRCYDFIYEVGSEEGKVDIELRAVFDGDEVPSGFRFLQILPRTGAFAVVALYAGPAQDHH